jgi:hypothetical protein
LKLINIISNEFYAVTDFHDILVIKVTEQSKCHNSIKVKTILNDIEASEHRKFHHQEYFEKMYFNLDGSPNQSCVFNDLGKAKEYTKKNILEEIESKKNKINNLENKMKKIESL